MLTRSLVAIAALSLAAGAPLASAQVQPEAKAKLQAMADAIRNAPAYSFSVALRGTGVMSFAPEMKGDVTIAKGQTPGNPLLRVEGMRGTSDLDKTSKEMSFVLTFDGTYRTWIDHGAKQVMQRLPAAAANAEANTVTDLIIPREFVAPDPFADQLAAPKIELETEPATADGVKCEVIDVDLGENKDRYRWCVGEADHLPRKVVKEYAGGGMSQVWSFKNFKLNPSISEQTWKVPTPEGYTFSAAPAPPAPPAHPTTTPAALPGAAPGAGLPPGTTVVRNIGTNVNDLAPDFELPATDGSKFKLSEQRGQVVLLDFWGSWCPPCRASSAEVQKLMERYKGQTVKFEALSVREKSDEAPSAYMKEHNLTYTLLPHADEVAKTYHVRNFPSFYVIGKDGQIVYAFTGQYDDQVPHQLADAIDAALAGRMPGSTPAASPLPLAPGKPPAKNGK